MLSKTEHINYWKQSANDDWSAVLALFNSQHYLQSLFFTHLTIEKLLKGYWVKDNGENTPPKIHNLKWLVEQTKLELSEEQLMLLEKMNTFQLEGRYPDYQRKIHMVCTLNFTQDFINQANILRVCLLENLQ
jgi:HEPN domain-containing protein